MNHIGNNGKNYGDHIGAPMDEFIDSLADLSIGECMVIAAADLLSTVASGVADGARFLKDKVSGIGKLDVEPDFSIDV
ncbi:MAG: hypothetical protein FWC00_01895 [Firmicutes bacterium]|nr:hypothetical protein [Bacillota bacterium]